MNRTFLLSAMVALASTSLTAGSIVVMGTVDLTTALATFRANIGGGANNANAPGTQVAGHREVNWDAAIVPILPSLMAGDFFNTSPTTRGLVMTTPGTGFELSATNFTEINALYLGQFSSFSPSKTIAAQGSNITDVFFRVPASSQTAFVSGFGVVFADVDLATSTGLQFFTGLNGQTSLGSFLAPAAGGSFSFLGVSFNAGEQVTRVRITAGSAGIGAGVNDISSGGTQDLVIMDDFLFSEPQAVPEPGSIGLTALGLMAVMLSYRIGYKKHFGTGSRA